MKIHLFNSEADWLEHKKGKASASRINELLANVKREMTEDEQAQWKKEHPKSTAKTIEDVRLLSPGAKTYVEELFADTIADDILEPFVNQSMQHGKDEEPVAIEEVGKMFPFQDIEHYGGHQYLFCQLTDFAGCSPDALICENGKYIAGIEAKCPTNKLIHIDRLLNVNDNDSLLEHDKDIYAQIQMNMMCFDLKEWFFASYYSYMYEPKLRLHTVKIEPDTEMQALILTKLAEAEVYFNELKAAYTALL